MGDAAHDAVGPAMAAVDECQESTKIVLGELDQGPARNHSMQCGLWHVSAPLQQLVMTRKLSRVRIIVQSSASHVTNNVWSS
jgi:hypothetical protein